MSTITFTTKLEDVLTNATSCVLSNSAATIGIMRNDTGVVVTAAGTAMVNSATGTYTYDFSAPVDSIFYTAYIKLVASGAIVYREVVFYVGITSTTVIVPSAIIAQYVISTLGLFDSVGSNPTWPLYRSLLPDSSSIPDDIGAIYDTSPYTQGKTMTGILDQRYGIQFMIRSRDYDTGFVKAKALLESLQSTTLVDEIIGGTTFRINNISSVTGVTLIGTEESSKQRYLFSVNLLTTIKEL